MVGAVSVAIVEDSSSCGMVIIMRSRAEDDG